MSSIWSPGAPATSLPRLLTRTPTLWKSEADVRSRRATQLIPTQEKVAWRLRERREWRAADGVPVYTQRVRLNNHVNEKNEVADGAARTSTYRREAVAETRLSVQVCKHHVPAQEPAGTPGRFG